MVVPSWVTPPPETAPDPRTARIAELETEVAEVKDALWEAFCWLDQHIEMDEETERVWSLAAGALQKYPRR
jgi:hypothetical protein